MLDAVYHAFLHLAFRSGSVASIFVVYGPKWMPITGNFFQFKSLLKEMKYVHLVWKQWASQYGPILGLRLGFDRLVIISSYRYAREVLLSDEFEGRPDGFLFRMRSSGKRLGIVFTDGSFGQRQRKFCLMHLKEFGFGCTLMEKKLTEETNNFIVHLTEKCKDGPVQLYSLINVHVLNTLWTMIADKRHSPNDLKLLSLLDYIHASFHMQDMSGGILNQMPFIRFFGQGRKINKFNLEITNKLISFLKETVENHKQSIKSNHTRDLIDAFLHEIEKEKLLLTNEFTEEQLHILLLDLFMAGADTTTNTIIFLIQMLIKYPLIQKKAQKELDKIFQESSVPTLKDRNRLNYLEALIMEVQRFCNIAPTTIPHRAKKNVKINDFFIPKNTTVLVSLFSIHMDTDHWGDPETFRPERFLDSSGRVKNDKWLIPFGLGRRRCLGETLAKASVFKYVTSLLLNFSISTPSEAMTNFQPIDGAILFPAPFTAILTPRKRNYSNTLSDFD
ncbi:methyl farnesoate epoxidase-like [Lycorma delicatula]|uniref:methyl farnesoate epoxidase-like n=1 Tax=Lycorma delicatula TaxID=130591 RepID=UPI003F519A41